MTRELEDKVVRYLQSTASRSRQYNYVLFAQHIKRNNYCIHFLPAKERPEKKEEVALFCFLGLLVMYCVCVYCYIVLLASGGGDYYWMYAARGPGLEGIEFDGAMGMENDEAEAMEDGGERMEKDTSVTQQSTPKVRTEFPETWLWTDRTLGYCYNMCWNFHFFSCIFCNISFFFSMIH